MTICPETTRKAYQKRIDEGKTLEDIGSELCNGVKCPRRKAIRIVKQVLGEDFLIANSEKLGYDVKKVEHVGAKNPSGKRKQQKIVALEVKPEVQQPEAQPDKLTALRDILQWENLTEKGARDLIDIVLSKFSIKIECSQCHTVYDLGGEDIRDMIDNTSTYLVTEDVNPN